MVAQANRHEARASGRSLNRADVLIVGRTSDPNDGHRRTVAPSEAVPHAWVWPRPQEAATRHADPP